MISFFFFLKKKIILIDKLKFKKLLYCSEVYLCMNKTHVKTHEKG